LVEFIKPVALSIQFASTFLLKLIELTVLWDSIETKDLTIIPLFLNKVLFNNSGKKTRTKFVTQSAFFNDGFDVVTLSWLIPTIDPILFKNFKGLVKVSLIE